MKLLALTITLTRCKLPGSRSANQVMCYRRVSGEPRQARPARTDQPKSAIFSSPRMPSSRFSGLMSRWMTCLVWQYISAFASDAMYLTACQGLHLSVLDRTTVGVFNLIRTCAIPISNVRHRLYSTDQQSVQHAVSDLKQLRNRLPTAVQGG